MHLWDRFTPPLRAPPSLAAGNRPAGGSSLRIHAIHRLAVVPQAFLGEAFRAAGTAAPRRDDRPLPPPQEIDETLTQVKVRVPRSTYAVDVRSHLV